MLTFAIRLYLQISLGFQADIAHAVAHHTCEITLYAIVAPEVVDDGTTELGESLAEMWCRHDPIVPVLAEGDYPAYEETD
jgi:hypothetical protein